MFLCSILVLNGAGVFAQPGSDFLMADETPIQGEMGADPLATLSHYDQYNAVTGGDSVRVRGGFPCIGWVEDKYPDGVLQHRGYYDQGKLTVYRNYYADGVLEREFRSTDAVNSTLRLFHPNGKIRSEARYKEGVVVAYEDHYVSGALRYAEERHRTEPYYLRMDLYSENGHPVSLLQLVDKRKVEFLQRDYHVGGKLKCEGRARFDPSRMDTQRIGTWVYYDPAGTVVRQEDYQDGKLAMVR